MPADTVFARLGSKLERTEKLTSYCKAHPEFADIISVVGAALPSDPTKIESACETDEADGFVYLFKSGRRYKFGFTNDPDRRIRELGYQTSEPINKVHAIRTDDPVELKPTGKTASKINAFTTSGSS